MVRGIKKKKKEPVRPKLGNKVATIAYLPPNNRPTAKKIAEQTKVHFNTSEKFFDNEHDVINWIIDNQLSRRNITDDQRAYLIGKRYKEEKKAIGANRASIKEQVKQINKHVIPHNEEVKDYKSTSAKIAEQSKVSHATVERAEKFADAVDKVAENTGINPQKILSGAINASRKDIQNVSRLEPEQQKKVFEKIEKKRRWKFW